MRQHGLKQEDEPVRRACRWLIAERRLGRMSFIPPPIPVLLRPAVSHPPFIVTKENLPRLIFDILRHGYLATLNPKWRTGITLGIEDVG